MRGIPEHEGIRTGPETHPQEKPPAEFLLLKSLNFKMLNSAILLFLLQAFLALGAATPASPIERRGTCGEYWSPCGNTCCGDLIGYCADASKSLCCEDNQVVMDGICCVPGGTVTNGICCPAGEKVCGGRLLRGLVRLVAADPDRGPHQAAVCCGKRAWRASGIPTASPGCKTRQNASGQILLDIGGLYWGAELGL